MTPLIRPFNTPPALQLLYVSMITIARMGIQKKRTSTRNNHCINQNTAFTGSEGISHGGMSFSPRLCLLIVAPTPGCYPVGGNVPHRIAIFSYILSTIEYAYCINLVADMQSSFFLVYHQPTICMLPSCWMAIITGKTCLLVTSTLSH